MFNFQKNNKLYTYLIKNIYLCNLILNTLIHFMLRVSLTTYSDIV